MSLKTTILAGAAILVGFGAAANAQTPYYPPPQLAANPYDQTYQSAPPVAVPATPPSWSYDPYTSGLGPCPQRGPGDDRCSETMHPTYGQPSYWSR